MARILVNLDVDDVERAISFYTSALGLRLGRRFGADYAELLGAEAPLFLLRAAPGTLPFPGAATLRDYRRHWTPVHLDLSVDDLEAAVDRAIAAGARLELPVSRHAYGRLAVLGDPFGHGFCLIQFEGRGYDEVATAPEP